MKWRRGGGGGARKTKLNKQIPLSIGFTSLEGGGAGWGQGRRGKGRGGSRKREADEKGIQYFKKQTKEG